MVSLCIRRLRIGEDLVSGDAEDITNFCLAVERADCKPGVNQPLTPQLCASLIPA